MAFVRRGHVHKYLNRIAGPLYDRIDIHVEVTPVRFDELNARRKEENSAMVRDWVVKARLLQMERYRNNGVHCNAQISARMIRPHCALTASGEQLLRTALERHSLTARSYDRILNVACTVADLDVSDSNAPQHIDEAIQLRNLDRVNWAE